MGFINLAEKTINAKLVYYGIGMGGKTTSLQAIHGFMVERNAVQLVSIKTDQDATLLFDFLPINLGHVEGFRIRIQSYTVPGQPKYRLMRKYVLSGADAVVFVVDSERSRLEENLQSLDSLKKNLVANRLDPDTIPIVLQYNKRDLDDILSEDELDKHFKFRSDLAAFPSVATDGQGVFEAFAYAAGMLVETKVKHYGLGKGSVDPRRVAQGAVEKLWETRDRMRGMHKDTTLATVALTVTDETDIDPSAAAEAVDALVQRAGEILSDADLDVALTLPEATSEEQDRTAAAACSDGEDRLLDKTIRSNLELAERFGELDQMRILLERKNKELVSIAQNTVHDLNRPLAAIKLFLSSAAKGMFGGIEDKLRTGIENSLCAIRHMEGLIQDLVDSSRLDFDGVSLKFTEIDLTELVAGVVRTLRSEIEATGVGLRVTPLPTVKGDRWALTKIFMNLLGNAMQYSDPGRPPVVTVSAKAEDDRWVLMVGDNGIGIPSEDISRLFRRFERGTNTSGISGSGLGLHIIQEIALGHGGSVWVESEVGRGSTFFVAIPFEPVHPGHSAVTETAAIADL
jgi:signal transduction histidine kinase/signal recognition particle receptor subunit beta